MNTKEKQKQWNEKLYVLTIIGTILGLIGMMLYNHFSYYFNISAKMQNMGMGIMSEMKQTIESYLSKNINAVQTTAITLEYMMDNDVTTEIIENFLVFESNKYKQEIDENFSGIYGILDGEYIYSSNRTPGQDYLPRESAWYIAAKEASNKTALVSPYMDELTNTMMLSISKMFPDKDSAISIDITLEEIQSIIDRNTMRNLGYAFLVDKNGLVVAHNISTENGKNYLNDSQMGGIIRATQSSDTTYFSRELNSIDSQILSKRIMDDWYLIMVLDKALFFKDVNQSLLRNILLFGAISLFIIFFYIYSFRMQRRSMELERESNKKIERTNIKLIRALVRTIDAKDRYTNGHSLRVAEYALKIAQKLGKSKEEQQMIYYSGLLHDVGKIRVPEDIINKPGKLTADEFEYIKVHPITGYQIIKDIYDDKTLAQGVKYHHERYDGKGYPSGLSGVNIPEIARIIGVADTYDAMASNRSYRSALSQEKVREEIENGKGTQFDPLIADIMLEMIDSDKEYSLKEKVSVTRTILFIDDDAMNIKISQHIIKDEPLYNIINATSGKEALEILEKEKVDLVILDIEMPDMDGFQTLARIREKHNMPVIFMSGNKSIETMEKAIMLGVDDYLCKPIIPMALKETIHSVFNE